MIIALDTGKKAVPGCCLSVWVHCFLNNIFPSIAAWYNLFHQYLASLQIIHSHSSAIGITTFFCSFSAARLPKQAQEGNVDAKQHCQQYRKDGTRQGSLGQTSVTNGLVRFRNINNVQIIFLVLFHIDNLNIFFNFFLFGCRIVIALLSR
jgi:hypothetical protein